MKLARAVAWLTVLVPFAVFAQTPPPTPADGNAYAQLVLQALDSKNYHMLAALVVIGLTWAAKKYGALLPSPVGPFLKTDRGGALLVILLGVGTAIGNGLYAGAPFSGSFLLHGLVLGVTAAGGFNLVTKIFRFEAPPPAVAKSLLVLALAGGLLFARPARAETMIGPFAVSEGPTVAFSEYTPKNTHPFSVFDAAGLMVSFSLPTLSMSILGKSYDMLAFNILALGSLVSGAAGQQFGQLQLAGAITTLNSMVGLGYGHAIIDATGALPPGPGFVVLVFSIAFAWAPSSPPLGIEHGARGLPRGNTVYFGGL